MTFLAKIMSHQKRGCLDSQDEHLTLDSLRAFAMSFVCFSLIGCETLPLASIATSAAGLIGGGRGLTVKITGVDNSQEVRIYYSRCNRACCKTQPKKINAIHRSERFNQRH